jgi:hypothetical protein
MRPVTFSMGTAQSVPATSSATSWPLPSGMFSAMSVNR